MSSSTERRAPAAPTAVPRRVGPGRRAVLVLLVAALLVGGVVGALLAGGADRSDRPEADAPEPGSVEAVAAELAEGQQAQAAELAAELADAAGTAHDELREVLAGLATVVPPGDPAGGAADPATDTGAWLTSLQQAKAALEATGEGTDDHGVTRASLVGAVDLLTNAVETAAVLPEGGAGAPEVQDALERAARDRDAAVRLWQAGATRLDTLVVTTGGEHVHLFLAPDGDPDAVPEEFREPHADQLW